MEWWERAYPGAEMVGPPLVRPLYPPSAASRGKIPSAPGEDIQALKRAISRAGRWPWQEFDMAYSDAFALGSGGNVGVTGMAGFQRQQEIDDTGWVGEGTYNAIRSALVPDGLPHAGEHILDDTAVDLLWEYRRKAMGATAAQVALTRATSYLGYTESPRGTNGNMFGAWYGMNWQPWCAMFVTYCYRESATFKRGARYHYVPTVLGDALAGRNGLRVVQVPQPGDLVLYDWERNGVYDHMGLFERGNSGAWVAIEGNTSVGNDSNGGEVMRRDRRALGIGVKFVRVAEEV